MNKKIIVILIVALVIIVIGVLYIIDLKNEVTQLETELEKTQVYAIECFNKFPNDQRGFNTCYFYKIHPEYKIMKIEPAW